jgi:sterol O-acyltransferase
MDDNIDYLIESLKQLKQVKSEDERRKSNIVDTFTKKITNFNNNSQNLLSKLQELENEISKIDNGNMNIIDDFSEKDKKVKNSTIKYKKFKARESVLTSFFRNDEYQTIYNIFVSFLFTLIWIFIMTAIVGEKEIFNIQIYYNTFSGWNILLVHYYILFLVSCLTIIVINVLHIKGVNTKTITIVISGIIIAAFTILSRYFKLDNVAIFPKILINIEKLRVTFKLLAYFMEKVYRITYHSYGGVKPKPEAKQVLIIKDTGSNDGEIIFEFKFLNVKKELLNFIYFYLAPTLIYRDLYPRTNKKMNIKMIVIHSINIILCCVFNFTLFELCLIPYFKDTSLSFIEGNNVLQTLVNFIVISMVALFVLFFGFSHSLLNLIAEVLGFADRKFYKAFWNASTPNKFYKDLLLNWYDFFRYYLLLISETYISKTLSVALKMLMFCLCLEVIFYSLVGFSFPIISILIVLCSIGTKVMKKIKGESMILINLWFTSLGMGVIVLVSLTGYYIKNNSDFAKHQLTSRLLSIITLGFK